MKKSFLLGLGAVAASAFIVSKKLTESQKDRIAMKLDEKLLDLRDTVIKYNKYAHDYLDENHDTVDEFKEGFAARFHHLKDGSSAVSDAFSSLKQATSDLKSYIQSNKQEMDFDGNQNEKMQDDIIIEGPVFEENEAGETVTFFPEGWKEQEKSLDDNNEPQL